MHLIDILSFSLSLLGIYGPILLTRYLLPRNVTPILSTLLDQTQQLLGRAEQIGAIPPQSEYKFRLDRYEHLRMLDCPQHLILQCSSAYKFAMMRTESNHARGTFQQLRITLTGGLTCKLLSLYYQIESIKSELEVCTPVSMSITPSLTVTQLEVDQQQLNMGSAGALVASPADGKHVDTFLDVH